MGEKAWCKGFKGKLAVAIIIIILKIILIMHDIIYIRTLRKSLGSCINWIYWGFRETCGLCCMCSMYYLVCTRLFLHSHICNVYITYIYINTVYSCMPFGVYMVPGYLFVIDPSIDGSTR